MIHRHHTRPHGGFLLALLGALLILWSAQSVPAQSVDVNRQVVFKLGRPAVNTRSRICSFPASLTNTSSQPLTGLLRVEITPVGPRAVRNDLLFLRPDGRTPAGVPYFDFELTTPLAPGQTTAPRAIEVQCKPDFWRYLVQSAFNLYFQTRIVRLEPSGSSLVGPGGGTVDLPDVARVTFPSGTFRSAAPVTVMKTTSPQTQEDFQISAALFRPSVRLPYEIRINTGTSSPAHEFQVAIKVPASFLSTVPPNSDIQLFVQIWEDGGEERLDNFELFPSIFDAGTATVLATLPAQAFTKNRRPDGTYEAILTLAATPGAIVVNAAPQLHAAAAASATDECEGTSLGPPLEGNLVPNRHFNRAGETHPVTGQTSPHYGTDLRAADGDNVLAVVDGKVETAGYQFNATTGTGWGNYIILRHEDGSATLYAHLKQGSLLAQGTDVQQGDTIAEADSSGGVTGPHLHLEYAPNGQIFQKPSKVDPFPCIGSNVSTSITVGDNGTAADDAFQVFLDGLSLGQTSIGATNTLAAGNLRAGNHILKVVAVIAPDNVGTLGISLADGVTFADGGTTRSASLPQGGQVTYVILVPPHSAPGPLPSLARLATQSSEPPVILSPVALASGASQQLENAVVLQFSGRLTNSSALDVVNYVVLINGAPWRVGEVLTNPATTEVRLKLASRRLQASDQVEVLWSNLRDTQNRVLTGRSAPLPLR